MIGAAIYAPAATAQPIDPAGSAAATQAQERPSTTPSIPLGVLRATGGVNDTSAAPPESPPSGQPSLVESPSGGFDWADAAIGAAVMLGLFSLGTGITVLGRRGRGRPVRTS